MQASGRKEHTYGPRFEYLRDYGRLPWSIWVGEDLGSIPAWLRPSPLVCPGGGGPRFEYLLLLDYGRLPWSVRLGYLLDYGRLQRSVWVRYDRGLLHCRHELAQPNVPHIPRRIKHIKSHTVHNNYLWYNVFKVEHFAGACRVGGWGYLTPWKLIMSTPM